jgi:hypothetical protein
MKKLIVLLMVVSVASVASANLLVNGDFDTPFTSAHGGNFTGAAGSWAYTSQLTNNLPGWATTDGGWGYVRNWDGTGGTDIFGTAIGITSSPQGGGAIGSAGRHAHTVDMWQYNGVGAVEGETVKLTFKMNSLSLDYGVNAWLNANLQFIGDSQQSINYNATTNTYGVSQDTWTELSIETVVTPAMATHGIQVHFQAAGVWIDDVVLTQTPEPATMMLLGLGGLTLIRKRR